MSLSVAALQLCVVQALDGRVQAKVLDSSVDPRDLENDPLPVIIVYSSDGRRRVQGMEFFDPILHAVDLVLDLGVAHKTTRTFENGGMQEVVEFQATDASYDALLQTMDYECAKVLFTENGTWPELFRRFVHRFSKEAETTWARGALAEGGRQAFLRQTYRFEVVSDPIPGAEPSDLWRDLLAAMDADAELAELSKYWRSLITSPGLPSWRALQGELGLNGATMTAMGDGPISGEVGAGGDLIPATQLSGESDRATITVDADGATIKIGDSAPITLGEVTDD